MVKRKSMARLGLPAKKSFLESSDEEVPAPETPATKAPRLEARVQLPAATVAQFRSEAQRLVIDTEDLGALSQGAARENLEGRLGLEPGTFNSSRRLRHWYGEVLQGEVDKRAMRSARINQIAQALCSVEDYPLVCRRMLIEALPFATACPNGFGELVQPHPHQVRILEMVREVLQEAQLIAVRTASEASTAAASAVDSHDHREAGSLSAALATAGQTRATFEEKSTALRDATQVEERAKEDLVCTKQGIQEAEQNLPKWKQALSLTHTVRDGFLRPLKDGTCPDSAAKESSLDSLCRFMEDEGQQNTLPHAARMALVVEPEDRTNFLQIVVAHVEEFFDGRVQMLSSKIAEAERVTEPSFLLKEEAVCDAATMNTANRMLDLADAREKHQEAEDVCKVERIELERLHKAAMDLERTAVAAEARSAVFLEAVASIDDLSQCTEVPAPSTDRPCPGAEQASGDALGDPLPATPAGPLPATPMPFPATPRPLPATPGPAATDAVEPAGDPVAAPEVEPTADSVEQESVPEATTGSIECNAQSQEEAELQDGTATSTLFSEMFPAEHMEVEVAPPCSSSTEELRNSGETGTLLPISGCAKEAADMASTPPSPCKEAAGDLSMMTPRKSKEGMDSTSPRMTDVPTPQQQRRQSLP